MLTLYNLFVGFVLPFHRASFVCYFTLEFFLNYNFNFYVSPIQIKYISGGTMFYVFMLFFSFCINILFRKKKKKIQNKINTFLIHSMKTNFCITPNIREQLSVNLDMTTVLNARMDGRLIKVKCNFSRK